VEEENNIFDLITNNNPNPIFIFGEKLKTSPT
jgi:hypothetical protein